MLPLMLKAAHPSGHSLAACRAAGRLAAFAAALAACTVACAADPKRYDEDQPLPFEIVPFVGYRVGGGFTAVDTGQSADLDAHQSFGLALDLRRDEGSQYELYYGRQSTAVGATATTPSARLRVEYLHIGGTTVLSDETPGKPYLLGGLGVTHFTPDSTQGRADTRFSLSLGVGTRVPFSAHFSLRLEVRGYLTFSNSDTAFLCRSDQTGAFCQFHAHGSTFTQFDFLAGAAYAF
jgi:opacity protein-like surface antigen